MLIGVLFTGVLFDTLIANLVFNFWTVILPVAVLLLYWLSPLYVAVIVCVSTLAGVYACTATPLELVFTLYVLPATFNDTF